MVDKKRIKKLVYDFLIAIGEDPEREGLLDTPRRIADMYEEFCKGNDEKPEIYAKIFKGVKSCDEIVIVRDIPFSSMCEHHLLPFFGRIDIGYIPNDNGNIIGLSKIGRIVENFSKKLQIQERLTTEIVNFFDSILSPKAVIGIIEATHTCMTIRGIKSVGSVTQTVASKGKKEVVEAIARDMHSVYLGGQYSL